MAERLPGRRDLPPQGAAIHLLGAAGAGMRGIARVLADGGWTVSASDRDAAAAAELAALGVRVAPESDLAPVRAASLVVYSSALAPDHPALEAAASAGVPTWKRARALGALVNDRRLVAVAGTHGKTTVSAMLALTLEAAGRDPLAFVGGRVPAWDGNARPGRGREAVVEADEYDRSFLELDPSLAVVTSVEPEHVESYGDEEGLRDAFARFAERAAGRDGLLACVDDAGARDTGRRVGASLGYGLGAAADYRVEVVATASDGQTCRLAGPDGSFAFELGVPGDHNAQNAAGALAAALRLGVDPRTAAEALREFRGVARRLQLLARRRDVVVIDDYAHHPTEVRASIAALRRAWPGARLVVVFQPHLFSRTRAMATEFGRALADADVALVLPVYPAREEPIPGVDASLVVASAPGHVRLGSTEEAVRVPVESPGDTVVAFMGAGDVTAVASRAARELVGDALGA
jgi:UDP-N-acetylmuramate--alanine ligase